MVKAIFVGKYELKVSAVFFFPVQNTKLLDTLKWKRLSVEEDKGS